MDAEKRRKQNNTSYISGNTARKLHSVPEREYDTYRRTQPQVVTLPQREQQRNIRPRTSRQPHVGMGINFGSLILMLAAMAVTLYVCFHYLQTQSSSVQLQKQITALETKLTSLTDQNNAIEIAINKPVDLDQIYAIAVGELGMVYPKDNEIVMYEATDSGYVRQYESIPGAN